MWGALIVSWSTVEILACRMSEYFLLTSGIYSKKFQELELFSALNVGGVLPNHVNFVGSDALRVLTWGIFWLKMGTEAREKGSGRKNRDTSEGPMMSKWWMLWIIIHCMCTHFQHFAFQLQFCCAYFVDAVQRCILGMWSTCLQPANLQHCGDFRDLNEIHSIKRGQSEGDAML